MKLRLMVVFCLLFFAISCKKYDVEPTSGNNGQSYVNLTIGSYVIYDVDSIFYNDFDGSVTTYTFQIRELLESSYIDGEGETSYRIERAKLDTVESPNWVILDVWNSKITSTAYEKVENNQRFVKLVFPIRKGKTWNGNAKNNLSEWEYEYVSVHQQETIGGITLDSVATVTQFDDLGEILIQRQFYQEKFATGIGMVYKRVVDVKKAFNSNTGLYENSHGTDATYTLNSYGNL